MRLLPPTPPGLDFRRWSALPLSRNLLTQTGHIQDEGSADAARIVPSTGSDSADADRTQTGSSHLVRRRPDADRIKANSSNADRTQTGLRLAPSTQTGGRQ